MRRLSVALVLLLPAPAVAHEVSVEEYGEALQHVFQYRHTGGDFRAFGGAEHGVERLKRWRAHAKGPVSRKIMRQRTEARKDRWLFHQRIDRITVYGKWSIDPGIVACESGGSWSAYNPSGAAGPYQIMPEWGRPFPVYTTRDMAAHHVLAAQIWAGGSGRSNWVC